MKTIVEFNLITATDNNAVLNTACQLLEALQREQRRAYVYVASKNDVQELDDLLWSFRDDSFVPHQAWLGEQPASVAVLLGCPDSPAPPAAEVLINLTDNVPDFYAQFQHILEIISAEPAVRQRGRERFKYYKTQGCELITRQQ